jgi:hypothetical protein
MLLVMRYETNRSVTDNSIHVICRQGAFYDLPHQVLHLGPWTGSKEGDVERLPLHYRLMLLEQGFVLVYKHPLSFAVEPA